MYHSNKDKERLDDKNYNKRARKRAGIVFATLMFLTVSFVFGKTLVEKGSALLNNLVNPEYTAGYVAPELFIKYRSAVNNIVFADKNSRLYQMIALKPNDIVPGVCYVSLDSSSDPNDYLVLKNGDNSTLGNVDFSSVLGGCIAKARDNLSLMVINNFKN